MCDHAPFLSLQITKSDISLEVNKAVCLVIVYDHFNLPL